MGKGFYNGGTAGYLSKKRRPLPRLEAMRAMALITALTRPRAHGGYNLRRREGYARIDGERFARIRPIRCGQWAGPWQPESTRD